MKVHHIKRYLAMLLALVMLTSIVPTTAFATGEDDTQTTETGTPVSVEIGTSEESTEEEAEAEEQTSETTEAAEATQEAEDSEEDGEESDLCDNGLDEDLTVEMNMLSVYAVDASSPTGVTVSATNSQIVVHVNRVGESGKASLYRFEADAYSAGDSLSGLHGKENQVGTWIWDYDCGTETTYRFNRYQRSGQDNIYYKYYLIQDGEILAGPYYPTQISSYRSQAPFEMETQKGLTLIDITTIENAKDMDISNVSVNAEICQLIRRSEDANGNPVDYSGRSDIIEFESNGKTYYFSKPAVEKLDSWVAPYSQLGINVTLVVYAEKKQCNNSTYPESLMYITKGEARYTMAINTSNELGRDYWIAIMEFLAERYSKSASTGLVHRFVISNEIDYAYDWNAILPNNELADFDVFMEEYARTLRLANLATKKYNSETSVAVSITHNWAERSFDAYNHKDPTHIRYNTYAPKDILDWLCKVEAQRGNYNWSIAQHPYAIGTTSSKPTITDPAWVWCKPITGDMETSPWITVANLELLQLYLEQPYTQYDGQIRKVTLTEASVVHNKKSNLSAAEYQKELCEQAASIAQMYYRAAHLSCIETIPYFQLVDRSDLALGLMESDKTPKPSYDVWKYVDTNRSFDYSDQYLKYLGEDSWLDVMKTVESDFDWDAAWDESKIMTKTVSTGSDYRSVDSDKNSYAPNEAILVTANGAPGDIVGLYLAEEDPQTAEPIYSYPVEGSQNNLRFYAGRQYDLLTYGTVNTNRAENAVLKKGSYKLVLTRGDNGSVLTHKITITGDYTYGGTQKSIRTDKQTYTCGENIVVTASGNENTWVGLYKEDDEYGSGKILSIYWYYVNAPEEGYLSGKPTVLQNTTHNASGSSNDAKRIAAGEYILYLFDGSGGNDYQVVDSVRITVKPADLEPLRSITYVLDDNTDGFANGVVTITKAATNDNATDCVMYWADAQGEPLEDYAALAQFRLDGAVTTHNMVDYTIIPEGAYKLIAYASDGSTLSATAVSVNLPDNCTYELGTPLVEFQSISDIHVTTDSGAKNEVELANVHFTQMLQDVKKNSPDSIGIFIGGDIANSGAEAEYNKVYNLYMQEANKGDGQLPYLHIGIGNHDWIQGNSGNRFQRYAKVFNPDLTEQPQTVYYDEVVAGYHFIYLGGESAGLRANLSAEQIAWFDQRMEEITEEDPNKPVFVFLHQSFYNTVSGSLPGEGWDGVNNEDALKQVMKKYGQIILQNGHSHWTLDSESCMYPGDAELPVALNTASVGYLWSGYNYLTGEFAEGTQGYYVRVYEDKVVFMGRDFENGKWIPSAIFVLQRSDLQSEVEEFTVELDGDALNLSTLMSSNADITYKSSDTEIAVVTEDGTVIPKREGRVNIIITAQPTGTQVITRKVVPLQIGDADVYRVYGSNRFETALTAADAIKGQSGADKFDSIIIACGMEYPDALSGSYLAYVTGAPILLAHESNAAQIREYVGKNIRQNGTVYLLGGTAALSDEVAEGLQNCVVRRVWGDNRFLTNLAVLKQAKVTGGEILVCTGLNYADCLSAAAVKKPILMVYNDLLPEQKQYLETLTDCHFTIIGGENAVSKEIAKELKAYGTVDRIGGADRCETSVLIAQRYFQDPENAVLAYALNFPDGLSGGPLAISMNAPLLLVCKGYETYATDYLEENNVHTGAVLGGVKLLDDQLVRGIFGLDEDVGITTW